MIDTVFRSKINDKTAETAEPKKSDGSSSSVVDSVEVPYTDYETAHQKPYTVEHFKLDDLWDDPEGGFNEEISTIEKYFKHKIDTGDMANSVSAVKNELKELEKINNLKNEERITLKLGVLAAYVKFLMETDGIMTKVRKHANT